VRLRAVAELRSDDNPLSFEKLVATYLAKGRITEQEYQERRHRILDEL
jgi:hypothetical protein